MIRDVGGSYRKAIVETVHHYCGQRPSPESIDALKAEGCWNNDWEPSAIWGLALGWSLPSASQRVSMQNEALLESPR